MNIKEKNINNLPHWQRIWCHGSSNTSLVSYILTFLYNTWLYPTAHTFYINSHGASVWCKCIVMNIKENINNLPHWQRIGCHWPSNTSLVTYILTCIQSCVLLQNLAIPHCPDFLYKWSWGFCAIKMHCREHKREEYKQFTPLATYSVSLIQ